jgi:LPXTG-motif cell wall-anchored protein
MTRKFYAAMASCVALLAPAVGTSIPGDTQNIVITESMQVPRATLQPGSYSLAIEDRQKDRAVVRVSSLNRKQQFLLLAVNSKKLVGDASKGIILFNAADTSKQILRGWICPSCSQGLEFVYPKLEAAKITGDTGQTVLAVDPAADKLPDNLSQNDMKIATLWLLSPERIASDRRGVGLKTAKYEVAAAPSAPAKTVSHHSALAPVHVAAARPAHLPKTASNTFSLAAWGAGLMLGALALRARRVSA